MILDQYGNEIERGHSRKAIQYVKEHPSVVITIIPLFGAIFSVFIRFIMFLYKKGWAMYFSVPGEYILIGNSLSLYEIIVVGVILLGYAGVAVLTTRMWLRKEHLLKRIGCTFLLPMLFIFIFMIISLENPMLVFELTSKDWLYILWYLTTIVLFFHFPVVFAIGYFFAYPLNDDIIRKKENSKKGKNKKEKRRKKNRTRRDRRILALSWVAFIISVYFIVAMFSGYKQASEQKKFNVTYVEGKLYICVMNDGDNLILKRGIHKDKGLIIYGDKNMKVSSNGYLLKEVQYDNVELG